MSDDLNKKLKQVADILGQETLPDNIAGLLNLLTATNDKSESPPKASQMQAPKDPSPVRSEVDDNLEMVRKMKNMLGRINTANDPRVNLLSALKPFLNPVRQKKLSDCLKMLQLTRLTSLVDDHENDHH